MLNPAIRSFKSCVDQTQKVRIDEVDGTFDVAAAAAVWEMTGNIAQDVLSRPVRYSMLEWNNLIKRYRLHDLAHDFADDRLQSAEREPAERCYGAYLWAHVGHATSYPVDYQEPLADAVNRHNAEATALL